jgi:hypothetical protein
VSGDLAPHVRRYSFGSLRLELRSVASAAVALRSVSSPCAIFREKLFHVHAKDIRFDQKAACNEWGIHALAEGSIITPRIPGFGELDWGKFIGTLMEVGYDGPVCIEVEDPTPSAKL